jgi:dehydrogenase/reductase SDR family protein 12
MAMAQYQATIVAPIEISKAFDYLARFSSTSEWDPGVHEAEMVTPEPVGLGSAFRVVASVAGRKVPLRYEITEFDRPYKVTVRAENSSTVSEDTITFVPGDRPADDEPGDGGHFTQVRYDAHLRLKGAFRVFSPVLGLMFDRIGDRAAGGLRAALLDRADAHPT